MGGTVPDRWFARIGLAACSALLVTCCGVSAEDSKDKYALAREHLARGRYAEAAEAFGVEPRTATERVVHGIGLSGVHEARGRVDLALEVVGKGLEAEPASAELWARLAELEFRRGRYVKAEVAVKRALKVDPQHPRARLVRAELWTETGRLREADEGYRWFVRYYNRRQPTDAESLLLIARGAVRYARWHGGSQVYQFAVNTLCPDALKADPSSWQAHLISGRLLLEKYNRAQAIPDLQKALAINPRAAEVHVALGRAALDEYDLDEVESRVRQALAHNPRQVEGLLLQADLAWHRGRLARARQSIAAALSQNPRHPGLRARDAALVLVGNPPPSTDELDRLLAGLDDIESLSLESPSAFAKQVIDVARDNPRPGRFLYELAVQLDAARRYRLAERFYRAAMRVMPQLPEPKAALGMLLMRVGRVDQARRVLDEAFRSDPFHVRVSNMRKVLEVLEGYDAISTEHFVVHVDSGADRLLGRYMAEYLETEYARLVREYGYEPPVRTRFEIYHSAKGQSAHQWFSARMVGLPWIQTIGASTGHVVAMASPTASRRPFNWARVVTHELVHVFTLQQTRFNMPRWLTEALAVAHERAGSKDWKAAGSPVLPATWTRLLVERVPEGRLSTLATIDQAFLRPESPDDWQFAYCQSRLYVQYIVEAHGPEAIGKLVSAYREGRSTAECLRRACGVEFKQFEAGYRQYLERLTQQLPRRRRVARMTPKEIERSYKDRPDDPKAAGRFALMLLGAKRRGPARKLAEEVLAETPNQPHAALVVAILDRRAERLTNAAEVLERALDPKQPHHGVLALLARTRIEQQEYARAVELCELGRKHFASETGWLESLVKSLEALGRIEALQEPLESLVRLDADRVGARKKLARLHLDAGRPARALEHARGALYVDVLDADVHGLLGAARLALKQPKPAIDEYKTALELKPKETSFELGLARSCLAAGDRDQARSVIEMILKREPDNAEAATLKKQLDPPADPPGSPSP